MSRFGFGHFSALDEVTAPDLFVRADNFALHVEHGRKHEIGIESGLIARSEQSIYSLVRGWLHAWMEETKMQVHELGGMVIASCTAENLRQVAEDLKCAERIPGPVRAVDDGFNGFPAAVETAIHIADGKKPVVIVAAEMMSRWINWEPLKYDGNDDAQARGTAAKIFRDGVAGVSLGPLSSHPHEILGVRTEEVDDPDRLIQVVSVEDSIDPFEKRRTSVHRCLHVRDENIAKLLDFSSKKAVGVMDECLRHSQDTQTLEEWETVGHAIPHQLNRAITEAIRVLLAERSIAVHGCLERTGSIAAAFLPATMRALQEESAIEPRQIIAMPAVGARGPNFVPGKLSAGCVLVRKGNPRH